MDAVTARPGSRSPPVQNPTTEMLTDGERRLLEMVRRVGYGSLGNVRVRNGAVVLGRRVCTRRRHRLGREDNDRCTRQVAGRFKLKQQHHELVARIRILVDAMVTIEIQDGLPMDLIVTERQSV